MAAFFVEVVGACMKVKEFVKGNKENLIKWLGILLMCLGVFGLVFSFFGGNNEAGNSSDKIHLLGIGVDKYEVMGEREPVYNSIGQADGIFLITIDTKKNSVDIVAVPRDTMVTLQMYYSNMEYIGEGKGQICLQYAYADGKERSSELMVEQVEALFDGIEIDGYVAINMMSVLAINDAIGGVTVVVNNEDTAQKMGVSVGSNVHLTNENISLYLQSRDKMEAQSAYGRMDRMKDYVKAFIPQAMEKLKENPTFVVDIIRLLGENMVTDIDVVNMVQIASSLAKIPVEKISYQILEGSVVLGASGYEEFYPDEAKLKKIINDIR